MADATEGSSTNDFSSESSGSTVQLNIKTLDSRIYNFHVEKNIVVSAFKEKIASQSGVPIAQQRLIFRGRVLKDDHRLSEYNVENGDTLHLVERQPQRSPESGSGEPAPSNGSRGQDSAGGSRNRIGHIAHSVVLGTLNVGDPGEAGVPDLSRVIGAVLNSMGIGNVAGGMHPGVQPHYRNETEGSQASAGSQSQGGNQSVPWQASQGQFPNPAMQIPLGAAIAAPSMNMPIPDSLHTLSEFMNRLEHAFPRNGIQPNQSATGSSHPPAVELPTNSGGLPTVEALSIVLRHADRLLGGHAATELIHNASRLEQEEVYGDPGLRGQVQLETMQLGVSMQNLGALLLELGRTMLMLRMGQSPAESLVHAGPAVYISPHGPNPIMVQPFPLQTTSLFGGSSAHASNPAPIGPVGVGGFPRNVNIHIHTGASLVPTASTIGSRAPTGERMPGERVSGPNSGDSGQGRSLSGMNIAATAGPAPPTMVSISGAVQPGATVSQGTGPNSISSMVDDINAQLRSLIPNMQNENHAAPGQPDASACQEQPVDGIGRDADLIGETNQSSTSVTLVDDHKVQTENQQPSDSKEMRGVMKSGNEPSISSAGVSTTSKHGESPPSRSNLGSDPSDGSSSIPLGLGLGGLQPKRRSRQLKTQAKSSEEASASSQNQQSRAVGQKVLQSLASLSAQGSKEPPSLGESPELTKNVSTAAQNADDQIDMADAMSQALHSPELDGLLAGVSQQTGLGSPDMLRNMMQQLTQNPGMRNVMNQMAQQIDSHDLGSMFSGLDGGQGGGIDLSRMMQQMMPIVSQALGGGLSSSQQSPPMEVVLPETRSRSDLAPGAVDSQIDLQRVVQRIENQDSPQEIFRSLVDRAVHLSNDGSGTQSLVDELANQGELAQEFMEMLRHDISRRLEDEKGS